MGDTLSVKDGKRAEYQIRRHLRSLQCELGNHLEYKYTVLFESVREGGYHVTVPAFPEIVTYGETLDEAREMASDAIRCVLESMIEGNEPIPPDAQAQIRHETLAVAVP